VIRKTGRSYGSLELVWKQMETKLPMIKQKATRNLPKSDVTGSIPVELPQDMLGKHTTAEFERFAPQLRQHVYCKQFLTR
jgi:hypothetical protein